MHTALVDQLTISKSQRLKTLDDALYWAILRSMRCGTSRVVGLEPETWYEGGGAVSGIPFRVSGHGRCSELMVIDLRVVYPNCHWER